MTEKKLNGTVIVTYRCNARCSMCSRYRAPSRPEEEISIETIRKLPKMYFTNITGGEPFIRTDLKDIVRELYKKSDRIVISTNGFFTDRIIDLCREFPHVGIRISIEGLEDTNNEIRGLPNGYQRGYTTLKALREMGMKDVGFGMTVQDRNAPDLVPLYKISDELGMEFATASLHNSFYFVEAKNIIHDRPMVAKNLEALINELLKSGSPKKWFRAYFNHGLINYIYGQKRLLPCDMSFDTFFIDPYGDVMPCNGTKDKEVMGNLNRQSWDELWSSPQAEAVRARVRCCTRECWMIGSVSPAMHRYIWVPAAWVAWHKCKALFTRHPYSMYENKICRDYRDGRVTREELDRCSTCDLGCAASNGLSRESQAQLMGRTGEEIVDADIAEQLRQERGAVHADGLVSVVVPVYRTEAFLNRCVESIVGQTYANLEILLVDDGSPDSCPRLCDEWAARDSRVKVIHQANAGAGMARNAGIEAAAGDFICFFDSDDYVAPDAIEKAYRLAMAEQSDLVVFGLTTLDTAGRVTARIIPEPDRITFAGEDVQKRFLPDLIAARAQGVCRNIWMNAWSCLFSMPMIRKTGWRFVSEREIISEDVYSLLCLYQHVRRVSVLPEALYFYCENSASLTHAYRADRFEAICRFHDASVRKALELGCPEASERFQGLLLRFVIAAMKQIVCADVPERDRYRAIRDIVHSDYLKRIRWDYSLHFDSRARRLFLFSLDKGLTPVCYLLLKAKTAGH